MGKKTIHGGLILRATLASGSGHDLLTISPTGEITSISGTPLTTTLTAGQLIVGNASNVATATAITGDVTINSSGVTAIGAGVIVNADINASAAIAHSKMAALTASRALVSDGLGVVSISAVTSTELGYISGLTSSAQTQINGKQATITGAATTITSSNLTANRALIANASGKVEASSITSTELGYLSGVSSNIQTQFSGKLSATISGAAEGDIIYHNGTTWVNLARGTSGQTLQSTGSSIQWASATANGIAAGGTSGQVLSKQSSTDYDADWETLTVSSISDLTATAAELNLLDGVTATTTEINYLDGVTSNIQSQFGNKLSNSLPHNAIFVGNVSNIATSLAAGSEGQVLTVSSGTPTWTTISASGVTTIAAIDGTTKSANGAAISGSNIYLQTADGTYPGLVSTSAQTFAGVKTFDPYLIANGTLDEPSIVVAGTGANNHQYNGIGRDTLGHTIYQSIDDTYNHIWRAGTSSTTSDELMRLTGDGYLGLGGATPSTFLEFPGETTPWNKQIVFYKSADNDHQYTGFGLSSDVDLKYHIPTTSDNHIWYAGTSSSTSDELMKLTGGGDFHLTTATSTVIPYFASGGQMVVTDTRLTWDELAERMTIDGSLGVGAVPSYAVDVTAGTNPTVAARTSGTGVPGMYFQRTGGTASAAYFYIPSGSDTFRLQQNGTDYFHFTNGKLGIGANPTHKLDIQESSASGLTARILNTSTGVVQLVLDRSGGASAGGWSLVRPEASTSLVFNDGSSDEFTFATNGTATGTDWVATSDARVKTNISKVDDVLDKIVEIGKLVCEYDRTDNGKHETGFIAQELLKVAPEYVEVPEDPNQLMAVNYAKMVALLFKGIQQLIK